MAKATREDLLFIKNIYDTCISNLMEDLQGCRDILIQVVKEKDFKGKRDEEYFRTLAINAIIIHTKSLIDTYEFEHSVIKKAKDIISGTEDTY